MPKRKMVSIQVAYNVISNSIFSVADLLCNFDAVYAMKFVELIRVANQKVNRASLWLRRALLQKHLYPAKIHACEGRRLTPCEPQCESQLFRIEVDGGENVADRQARVNLLALHEGRCRSGHAFSFSDLSQSADLLQILSILAIDTNVVTSEVQSVNFKYSVLCLSAPRYLPYLLTLYRSTATIL